uniref:Uncharacterized protein n=1 Tax=Anguilla anguilla TaxID=7936 RepID=A0A0E9UP47_ANGAN
MQTDPSLLIIHQYKWGGYYGNQLGQDEVAHMLGVLLCSVHTKG